MESLFSLENKSALVTGGGRGIGAAIAAGLSDAGAQVGVFDRYLPTKTLDRIAYYGLDIGQRELLIAKFEEFIKEFKKIDILVNNAGITRDRLMMQMSDEEYDTLMSVNLRAAFMATRASLRSMIRNKFGRIISLSSVAGVMGQAGSANYAASKAGLIGMTKSLVREVAKKNITANCIAPGFIVTEMTDVLPDAVKDAAKQIIPARRFGTIEDVAKAIAFLASDDAGYINGQVICVDGGMAM